jgi:hypothetical protein
LAHRPAVRGSTHGLVLQPTTIMRSIQLYRSSITQRNDLVKLLGFHEIKLEKITPELWLLICSERRIEDVIGALLMLNINHRHIDDL